MTTITMRYTKGSFLVSGKDIEARKFESRREAKDWCVRLYPARPSTRSGRTDPSEEAGPCRAERAFAPKGSSHTQNQNPRRAGRGYLKAWAKLEEVPGDL